MKNAFNFMKQKLSAKRLSDYDRLIYFFILLYAVVISWVSISKYNVFETYAWDLGSYEQSMWSTLNLGKLFWNTPNFGILQIHFEPILFLILPIYAIYQSAATLLVIQATVVGLSALPVYWIAKKELSNKKLGFALALAYLINPLLLSVVSFDFHTEAFMPLFLMFSLYYFKEKKPRLHLLFFFLALMTKETVPLITVFLGAYVLFSSLDIKIFGKPKVSIKDRKWLWVGIVGIVASIAWFIMALGVLSYFLQTTPQYQYGFSYIHLMWWRQLGPDALSIIRNVIMNPLLISSSLIQSLNGKLLYVLMLLVPFVFTPIMKPWILLIPVPWLMALFVSTNSWYWSLGLQYPAPVVPFVTLAAIEGIRRLATTENRLNQVIAKRIVVLVVIATLVSASYLSSSGIPYIPNAVHNDALNRIMELVPPNASIITQNNLFPHFTHRPNAYPGYRSDIQFDYVLGDMTHRAFETNPGTSFYEPLAKVLPDLYEQGYGIVATVDGIILLQKNYTGEPLTLFKEGLQAEFFDNEELTGAPVFETTVFSLDWSYLTYWQEESPFVTVPNNNYSAVYVGYLKVPSQSLYTFRLVSSHGARLYIDGELKIDAWNVLEQDNSTSISMMAGTYRIRVEQLKGEGRGYITLQWKTPSTPFETISSNWLSIKPNY